MKEESLDWPAIVDANIEAIMQADALIVENSRFNYSSAFQTAIALKNNKPVLNLYKTNTDEFREWPDKLFISGINNTLFHNTSYENNSELPKIVEDFLSEIAARPVTIDVKLSINPSSISYLKAQSYEHNKSIPGVIKDLIIQHSQNQK